MGKGTALVIKTCITLKIIRKTNPNIKRLLNRILWRIQIVHQSNFVANQTTGIISRSDIAILASPSIFYRFAIGIHQNSAKLVFPV